MNKFLIIFSFFFLTHCCKDGIEINRYYLSDTEKTIIPYVDNQIIRFVHTNGYEFDMNVIGVYTNMERTNTEHCGQNYTSFETKKVELESNIPELYISVSIMPLEFNPYMSININRMSYKKDISKELDIDTLIINSQMYTNIYKFETQILDTNIIYPKTILYNKDYGIIKIKMTNNEEYSIIN